MLNEMQTATALEDQQELQKFSDKLRGELITPSDADYDSARTV